MKGRTFLPVLALLSVLVMSNAARASERNHIGHRKAEYLVSMLYRGALFREPDPQGLSGWAQQVVNGQYQGLVDAASGFGSSPEFNYNVYGAHSTVDILTNLYGVLLQRQVDPSGWAAWLPLLDQHRGAEVVSGIVSSEEFRRLHNVW